MSFITRLFGSVFGRIGRGSWIDERRCVYPVGRDEFKYCEDDHCLVLQIELLSGRTRRLLYPGTITGWLPPHEKEPISEAKRQEIATTIARFLNQTGESTEIFGQESGETGPGSGEPKRETKGEESSS